MTAAPYNVDSTGVADATTALQQAVGDAETAGTGVYLPQGPYQVTAPIGLNKVGVAGAGEWYTELTGHNVEFQGNVGQTTGVTVHDLSIFGNVDARDDSDGSVNGFNGGFNNTTISNVWIQNTKVRRVDRRRHHRPDDARTCASRTRWPTASTSTAASPTPR